MKVGLFMAKFSFICVAILKNPINNFEFAFAYKLRN